MRPIKCPAGLSLQAEGNPSPCPLGVGLTTKNPFSRQGPVCRPPGEWRLMGSCGTRGLAACLGDFCTIGRSRKSDQPPGFGQQLMVALLSVASVLGIESVSALGGGYAFSLSLISCDPGAHEAPGACARLRTIRRRDECVSFRADGHHPWV